MSALILAHLVFYLGFVDFSSEHIDSGMFSFFTLALLILAVSTLIDSGMFSFFTLALLILAVSTSILVHVVS